MGEEDGPVEQEYVDLDGVASMVQYAAENKASATNSNKNGTSTTNATDPPATTTTTTTANSDNEDSSSGNQSYPVNTPVLQEFSSGWYEGFITKVTRPSSTDVVYQVTWNDGTTDEFTNVDDVDRMVQNAIDYTPWTVGTPVYDEDDASYGRVSDFADGYYVVRWDDDGTTTDYYDFDAVDDLVTAAVRQKGSVVAAADDFRPWEDGTPVAWEFDDGWWEGTITRYNTNDGTYQITWSDGSVNTYTDVARVDLMVKAAAATTATEQTDVPTAFDTELSTEYDTEVVLDGNDDDDSTDYYDIGTVVYREFDTGWWVGNIVSYEGGYYTVRWTDNSFTYYEVGSEEIDTLVANAYNIPDDSDAQTYPIGTPVYKEFGDDGWFHGTIVSYSQLMYTVKWSDGEETYYVNGPDLDDMVSAAEAEGGDGMTTSGKAVLSVTVLAIAVGLAVFRVGKLRQRSKTIQKEVQKSVEEVQQLDQKSGGYYS
jgi:hypothetical protein